ANVKAFLIAISLAGIACLVNAAIHLDSPDVIKFAAFFTLAIVSAGVEFPAPVAGTLPITFLFVLVGALELTPSETVILSTVTAVVQAFWSRANKPGWDQVAFKGAVLAIASTGVVWVHHSSGLAGLISPVLTQSLQGRAVPIQPLVLMLLDTTTLVLLQT